jgi:N-acetylglutamate synthase-like GNAT family acetyltransferase
MSLVFRIATRPDLPAIRCCAQRAFQPLVDTLGVQPIPLSEDYGSLIDAGLIEVMERDQGHFVGFVYRFLHEDSLMVDTVSILPTEQNLGHLVQIGIRSIELARQMKVAKVRTYTNEKLQRNISMLIRMGFTVAGRRETPDRVFVDMELDLTKPREGWGRGARLADRYRTAIATIGPAAEGSPT